jgi:hypothetical protein
MTEPSTLLLGDILHSVRIVISTAFVFFITVALVGMAVTITALYSLGAIIDKNRKDSADLD